MGFPRTAAQAHDATLVRLGVGTQEGGRLLKFLVMALGLPAAVLAQSSPAPSAQSAAVRQPYQATSQRSSLTTDTSVTAAGTLEMELGGTVSSNVFRLPTTLKYSPDTQGWLAGTEFSVAFDALSRLPVGPIRLTRFGDRMSLLARREMYRHGALSLGLAPHLTFLLRDDSGVRGGGTGIAVLGWGRSTLVGNLTVTGATHPSATNPAWQVDGAFTYVRQMAAAGFWSRVTPFAGAILEKPDDAPTGLSLGQGIGFRARPNLVIDLAIREVALIHGPRDYRVLMGMTLNLGKVQ